MGRIMDLHCKKGVVKVKFQKAIPGQALETKVELLSWNTLNVRAFLSAPLPRDLLIFQPDALAQLVESLKTCTVMLTIID